MSSHLLRAVRHFRPLATRSTYTTTVFNPGDVQLDQATRDLAAPKIGNRDIVGYGFNGSANYWDVHDFPCPAVRWGENTPEFMQLRQKEQGDWTSLTIEDKKALYRGNFCQTYAEMNTHTGFIKSVMILAFGIVSLGSLFNILMKDLFYSRYPLPRTMTPEWQEAMLYRMVDQRQGRVAGVSSKYDYDNKRWKE